MSRLARRRWRKTSMAERRQYVLRMVEARRAAAILEERVLAGVRRARAAGKHLGRPRVHRIDAERARQFLAEGLSLRAVARSFKVHPMVVRRAVAAA